MIHPIERSLAMTVRRDGPVTVKARCDEPELPPLVEIETREHVYHCALDKRLVAVRSAGEWFVKAVYDVKRRER